MKKIKDKYVLIIQKDYSKNKEHFTPLFCILFALTVLFCAFKSTAVKQTITAIKINVTSFFILPPYNPFRL